MVVPISASTVVIASASKRGEMNWLNIAATSGLATNSVTKNTWKSNVAGFLVVGTVIGLGLYKLIGVFG